MKIKYHKFAHMSCLILMIFHFSFFLVMKCDDNVTTNIAITTVETPTSSIELTTEQIAETVAQMDTKQL